MRPLVRTALLATACVLAGPVRAIGLSDEEGVAFHGQATFVLQANANFRSSYQGPNSLDHRSHAKETFDLTLYGGVRPWEGAELWVNPEIDQGFGLSNTLGVAGFPSGEAYKVGKVDPYVKLPRWFVRQTIDLGGGTERVDPDLTSSAATTRRTGSCWRSASLASLMSSMRTARRMIRAGTS